MLTAGFHPVPPGHVAAIVTHLEMTRPPEAPGPGLPDGMALRRVESPDPDWYRALYSRVGAEDWLWFSRLAMPREALATTLADPDVEVRALVVDGHDEGLMELDFRQAGECELAFLGLTRGAQGRGAGRALVAEAVRLAFARDVARLTVHTCTLDAPQALPFYIRSGFVPLRREVEIAPDPRLDGTLSEGAAGHHPILRG